MKYLIQAFIVMALGASLGACVTYAQLTKPVGKVSKETKALCDAKDPKCKQFVIVLQEKFK